MIREEYEFEDIQDYLYETNDLLIVGKPMNDDRSKYFFTLWEGKCKDILSLSRDEENYINYSFYLNGVIVKNGSEDLCIGLPKIFRNYRVSEKNILIDLSSLDHIMIMFITKVLITQVIPKSLFATYIRPSKYVKQSGNIGFSMCDKIIGVNSVPGFAKRESDKQTLCSFVGFEGIRLKNILESVNNIQKFIPIVAFPSGSLEWYNVTMWNSMDILQSESGDVTIHKCFSESIFEAVELLKHILQEDEKIVLAPLGTRPHSMACAIYASQHANIRIIYDYVVECEQRAVGIEHIMVYHLSSFLNT